MNPVAGDAPTDLAASRRAVAGRNHHAFGCPRAGGMTPCAQGIEARNFGCPQHIRGYELESEYLQSNANDVAKIVAALFLKIQ